MSQVERNGSGAGAGASASAGGSGSPGGTLSAMGLGANLDTEVGKLVVDMGLATSTEIEFCREQQKQSSDPNQRSLADLLVEHSFITVNQAKRIRSQLDVRKGSSQIPGYELHKWKGYSDKWSISVSGHWRITFNWIKGDAYDVDLEQPH